MDKDWMTSDDKLDDITFNIERNGKQTVSGSKGSKVDLIVSGFVGEAEKEEDKQPEPEKEKEESYFNVLAAAVLANGRVHKQVKSSTANNTSFWGLLLKPHAL